MAVSGRVPLLALIHAQAADCLLHRVQDRGPVLGEEVAVNVLGRLDPAVPHLVGLPPSPSRPAASLPPRGHHARGQGHTSIGGRPRGRPGSNTDRGRGPEWVHICDPPAGFGAWGRWPGPLSTPRPFP